MLSIVVANCLGEHMAKCILITIVKAAKPMKGMTAMGRLTTQAEPPTKPAVAPGVRIVVASPDLPETRPRGRKESRCAVLFL